MTGEGQATTTGSHVRRALRALVGDRTGALLLVGALVVFALTWRVGPFINDNYTLANTLVAVADGHLDLRTFVYGPSASNPDLVIATPGMHVVDGRLYGRNYGQVLLALPVLWLLSAVGGVVDVSVALSVAWSALLFALVVALADRLNRRRAGAAVGGALAVLALAGNLAVGTPISPDLRPLLALQASTLLAAAFVPVVLYRTAARLHGDRVGAAAGAAVVLATPVGFWATIPKRHTLTALAVVVALYCLLRSRSTPTVAAATRFRALAYVPVPLTAWVHAPEGVVLGIALGVVDLATARSNAPRQLAVVAATGVVAALPLLVTNTLVAGTPFQPPRLLPGFATGEVVSTAATASGSPPAGGGGAGGGRAGSLVAAVALFVGYMADSVIVLADPGRLFDVFVRSGHGLGMGRAIVGGDSVNIAVLEAMPLAAVLLSAPVGLYRRVSDGGAVAPRGVRPAVGEALRSLRTDPARTADAFALTYVLLLVVMYLPRLPIRVSFTVRYLHPLYPLLVYALVRSPPVRRVVDAEWRLLGAAYAVAVLVGGPVFVGALAVLAGELEVAVQYHARLGLAMAAVLLYWAVVATATGEYERGGAVALGAASAVTTLYVLLSAWVYFPYADRFAVPLVRLLADLLVLW